MCIKCFKMCIITVLALVELSIQTHGYTTCKIPNGHAGSCVSLKDCLPLFNIDKNTRRTTIENTFLRQSVASCNSHGRYMKVCCPPKSQWSNLAINPVVFPKSSIYVNQANAVDTEILNPKYTPNRLNYEPKNESVVNQGPPVPAAVPLGLSDSVSDVCGSQPSTNRIVGGSATDIDEYPWLALLEYEPKQYRCGGSLITNRFVLTAAHCLIGVHGPPSQVRLSEYNLTTEPEDFVERNGGGFDKIIVTIIPVEQVIPHTKPYENDIGLIKMANAVKFSYTIKTICLPTQDYARQFTGNTTLVTAGWGSDTVTVNTEVKMDVTLPYVAEGYCAEKQGVVDGRYICAGGVEGEDSCAGDSGGPLMYGVHLTYILVGIVASGPPRCGTEGRPGEYTYVYTYLDWIYETIDKF